MPKGTTEPRELAVIGEHPGVFRAGMWERVAFMTWFDQMTMESVETYARVIRDIVSRLGGGHGSIVHLLNERLSLPVMATRPALVKSMEESQALSCVSVLIEGSGFWVSAFRGFLTSMRLLGPSSFRIHEHATLDEVVTWLPAEHEKLTGQRLDPQELAHYLAIAKHWRSAAQR